MAPLFLSFVASSSHHLSSTASKQTHTSHTGSTSPSGPSTTLIFDSLKPIKCSHLFLEPMSSHHHSLVPPVSGSCVSLSQYWTRGRSQLASSTPAHFLESFLTRICLFIPVSSISGAALFICIISSKSGASWLWVSGWWIHHVSALLSHHSRWMSQVTPRLGLQLTTILIVD